MYNVYGYVTQIDLNQTRLYGFTESTEKECVIYLKVKVWFNREAISVDDILFLIFPLAIC